MRGIPNKSDINKLRKNRSCVKHVTKKKIVGLVLVCLIKTTCCFMNFSCLGRKFLNV